jgi:hypothetical protein
MDGPFSDHIKFTYGDVLIFKTLSEDTHNSIFMLLLNNSGSSSEDSESSLTQTRLRGLASLEEDSEELWPLIA